MSLDIYLESTEPFTPPAHHAGIFIRHDGHRLELSREQWDHLNPGVEPAIAPVDDEDGGTRILFEANVTHNLGGMAREAGIYDCLWRAPENAFATARQLIEPLTAGIAAMKAAPARFERFNPPNGWGSYEHFVPWLERLLVACEHYPDAEIRTSR